MTDLRHQRIARFLRGALAERKIPKSVAAKHLDMPPQTFSRKINGSTPFTVDEVDQIVGMLGMTWVNIAEATE